MTNKKTVDIEALLKWAQPNLRRQSWLQYPNPQVMLEVSAVEFWGFVMAQTGITPDELNATLDLIENEK